MADKYTQARTETQRLNALLGAGTALADANESQNMNNLVRTGLTSILTLLNHTTDLVKAELTREGEVVPPPLVASQAATKVIIDEINLACHRNDQAQSGKVILDLPLISDFWFDYEPNTETKFKESDARSISPFIGSAEQNDLIAETFLLDLNQVGLSTNLSERGMVNLFLRKISGNALHIIKSNMELLGMRSDTCKFTELVSLFESLYMRESSPRAARLALSNLPQMEEGNHNYQHTQAVTLRLAKLATRDERDDAKRLLLQKVRALDAFVGTLNSLDKAAVIERNTELVRAGNEPMALPATVLFLETCYADKKATESFAPTYSSTIRQVAQEEQVNWAQRGRGRGRGRGEGGRGRGGNHRPLEGAPPPPRQGAYNPQPQKSALPEYFNHEKLGIAKGTCFACGVPGHTFRNKGETQVELVTNPTCSYRGVKLHKSICFKCKQGLHSASGCHGPLQQATQALKAQHSAQNKPEKVRNLEELESHLSYHHLPGDFEDFLEEDDE